MRAMGQSVYQRLCQNNIISALSFSVVLFYCVLVLGSSAIIDIVLFNKRTVFNVVQCLAQVLCVVVLCWNTCRGGQGKCTHLFQVFLLVSYNN